MEPGKARKNKVRCHARHKERSTSPSDQESMCSRLWIKKKNVNIAPCLSTPSQDPNDFLSQGFPIETMT